MDRKSPAPLPGLPSFPPPALPNPPSKSLLALQGLDQALVDAEVVDPATLLTISLESEATETGLGERTRKRLIELGITELFAGLFVSLVHRLIVVNGSHCFSTNETSTVSPSNQSSPESFVSSLRSPSRCLRVSSHRKW
jgi:hypothetical protein